MLRAASPATPARLAACSALLLWPRSLEVAPGHRVGAAGAGVLGRGVPSWLAALPPGCPPRIPTPSTAPRPVPQPHPCPLGPAPWGWLSTPPQQGGLVWGRSTQQANVRKPFFLYQLYWTRLQMLTRSPQADDWGPTDACTGIQQVTENKQSRVPSRVSEASFPRVGKSIT